MTKKLLIAGMILFLLSLLNGAAIPYFENPRMGLAAHTGGLLNGMVLIIFGLLWNHCHFTERAAKWCYGLSIFSMFAIWIGLLLAAIWGTSRSTPIAGAGFSGTSTQEAIVDIFLYSGSTAIIVASVMVIMGLWKEKNSK